MLFLRPHIYEYYLSLGAKLLILFELYFVVGLSVYVKFLSVYMYVAQHCQRHVLFFLYCLNV